MVNIDDLLWAIRVRNDRQVIDLASRCTFKQIIFVFAKLAEPHAHYLAELLRAECPALGLTSNDHKTNQR